MKTMRAASFISALGLFALTAPAPGQAVFSENFDVNATANWTVNTLGAGLSDANFFFDYGTLGIPSAPNSTGGTTRGLMLRANQFAGTTAEFPSGVSVSPIGQSFSGDYALRFDIWWNFNGPAPAGGSGSTQVTGAGIGTAGTSAQIAGNAIVDSLFFGATGEGGSSADYRAYAPAVPAGYQDTSGVYPAGGRNAGLGYYSAFGGGTPPGPQTTLFPQQTGAAGAGAPGFAWHDSVISKSGDTVTWTLDGLLLASVDLTTAGTLGGQNILFNQYDINATISTDPNSPTLLFGLIDNVRVVVPEPGTGALALLGGVMLWLRRSRR
jgi:hypothetical protein